LKKITKPISLEVTIITEEQKISEIAKTLTPAYKRLLLKKILLKEEGE